MNFDELVTTSETDAAPRRAIQPRRQKVFVVGGLPSVSLLPREFHSAARDKTVRRGLVGLVVVALIVATGATALAAMNTSFAQQRLDAATTQSQSLAAQLGKFADIQQLQKDVQLGQAAVTVGSSPAIDWQKQLGDIEENMPSGYVITTITADSANAVEDYPQGTSPLDQPRAASLVMTVAAPSITELPIWLRKLRSIPAYADATASVANNEESGYTVQLTLHLSPKALVDAQKGSTK